MALAKLVIIDIDSLLRLMTHYSDGAVPLDAEAREFGYSQYMPRWLQIIAESKEWTKTDPLHIRFEGGKVMNLDGKGVQASWADMNDSPKRQ